MKTLSTHYSPSFCGIKKPYINKNGYKIIPITQDPSEDNIAQAINAAKIIDDKTRSGCNGRVFIMGEDLVVKKYFPNPNDDALKREVKALDTLFERNITGPSIQEGKYGFSTPEGEKYLVSSRIKGDFPNSLLADKPKFNEKNLGQIIDCITKFDIPKRNGEAGCYNFPYEIIMHYDLSEGNLNISDESVGIMDFEYMHILNLEERYLHSKEMKHGGCSSDLSDIGGLELNLRNFERRALYHYITRVQDNDYSELFKQYLNKKADYQNALADFYKKEGEKYNNCNCSNISNKYRIHAWLLKKASKDEEYSDIVESEARKIQICTFINSQSIHSGRCSKGINPLQIKEYILSSIELFRENLSNAAKNSDRKRMHYYFDCINFMESQKNVIALMEEQMIKPYENSDKETYQKKLDEHELFIKKCNNNYQKTLEKFVCNKN